MLLEFDWAGPPSAPYARSLPHPFSLASCPCDAAPPRNPSLAPFSTLIFKYSWASATADEGVIKSHSLFSVLCSTLRHPSPYSDLVVGARKARAVGC